MCSVASTGFTPYSSTFSGRDARRTRVGKSLTSSFRQIADAIRASRPYDRIEVESGKYFEALSIKHPLELCSAMDGEPPIIISRGPCLTINAAGPVLIQSLTIIAKGTMTSDSQSILIEHGSPLIQDCELSSVYVTNDATPHISHCHICNSDYGCGLSITGKGGGLYVNNDISYHNEWCAYINTSGKPELSQNRLSQKTAKNSRVVEISGRLLEACEPIIRENIIRCEKGVEDENQMDPSSVYSPKMLIEDDLGSLLSLVRVTNGAAPLLVGNLLCNGVTGFHFQRCKIPPKNFHSNRVLRCSAWGIIICVGMSLISQNNDIQNCGGGIYVSSSVSSSGCEANPPCVTLTKCSLLGNSHYGILLRRASAVVTECTVSSGSVGIALLGNCSACTITKNELSNNSTAAFSVLRQGVATIENNTISGSGMYGVFVQDESKATFRSNNIVGVPTTILVRGRSYLVAEQNRLREASVHHLVLVDGSKATIQNNYMEGSKSASVVVTSHSECNLNGNVIYSSLHEGVLVEDGAKANIEKNNIRSTRQAIYVKAGGSVHVENNDMALGHYGIVVEGEKSNCVILGNRFINLSAIAMYALKHATVTVMNNVFSDLKDLGLKVSSGAEATVEKNDFKNCSEGAVCIEGVETKCKVLYCSMEGGQYGVRCSKCCISIIQGNHIRYCKLFGVVCDSDNSTVVQDNKIAAVSTGILLSSHGDIHDNVVEDCGVGISAQKHAVAVIRDHCIQECVVGVSLLAGTGVSISAIEIRGSKEFGVVVDGPSADVKVCSVVIGNSGMAGVVVRNGGICRFESCVIQNNPKEGIRLDCAGGVVFEQCAIMESCQGIKVSHSQSDARAAETPLLVNCTVDGNLCEEGVVGTSGGILRLECCSISACSQSHGYGIILQDGATVLVSRCEITRCPHAGLSASPASRALLDHTTVDNCGIGILFTSPSAQVFRPHDRAQTIADSSDTPVSPSVTQLTIRRCKEAGIFYEPCSAGVVSCTTVEECTNGVVVERESYVTLHTTIVRASINCGILFLGLPSSRSELTQMTLSDSGEYGVKICRSVDCIAAAAGSMGEGNGGGGGGSSCSGGDYDDKWEKGKTSEEGSDGVPLLKILNSEILRNTKGGVMLEAGGSIEGCKITRNAVAGIICEGGSCTLLSKCHLENNEDTNILARAGSMLQLRECVIEHAPAGIRAYSTLRMLRCIVRHLGVAATFFTSDEPSFSSVLTECLFSKNETAVSSRGKATEGTVNALLMEKCVFSDNSLRSVCVEGETQVLVQACNFESSSEGVLLVEGASAVIEGCSFKGNLKAVSVLNIQCVEVKMSTFSRQLHYAISVTGDCGEVRIRENSFSESGEHGVILSSQSPVIWVSDNTFVEDACGILVQVAPHARMYNNCFRGCQTGLMLHGVGCCGDIFGNIFEQNVCGCHCKENSTAQFWRNTFTQNTEYGLFSTTEAKPVVVENNFLQHREDKSVALCIFDRGAGHFAFNQYVENVCGVRLGNACETVIINHSTFDSNGVSIDLRAEASVHVVACVFASSLLGDVKVSGLIKQDECVFAYDCFASKGCPAVTASHGGSVVVFCSIFFGMESTGVVLGEEHGNVMVVDSLFYRVRCGVYVEEAGGGSVSRSAFVHCATAADVCKRARTTFHACKILAQPRSVHAVPAVVLHKEATPTFKRCNFSSGGKTAQPLLLSMGSGLVEDSSFTASDLAVLLDCNCSTRLRRNDFLGGVVGIKFNPRCQAKVESNSFHRHHVAAVEIMDNASGELTANAFAQPLENGGILAGAHNVIVNSSRKLENSEKRATKSTMDQTSLEMSFLAAFVKRLEMAPYWLRRGMGETASAAALPEFVLSVMRKPEAKELDEKLGEEGLERDVSDNQNGYDDDIKNNNDGDLRKGKLIERRERGGKKSKTLQEEVRRDTFEFLASNIIISAPEDVQHALMAWVEEHGVALRVQRRERLDVPNSLVQMCDTEVLRDVGEQMAGVMESWGAQKLGNSVDTQPSEVRGATLYKSKRTGAGGETKVAMAKSVGEKRGEGKDVLVEPHDTLHGSKKQSLLVETSKVNEEKNSMASSASVETVCCPCLSAKSTGKGITQRRTTNKPPKRLHTLPPPLRSNDANAQPTRPPHRGVPLTFTACLQECSVHKLPQTAREGLKVDLMHSGVYSVNDLTMRVDDDDQFRLFSTEDDSKTWGEYDTSHQSEILSSVRCMPLGEGSVSQYSNFMGGDNERINDASINKYQSPCHVPNYDSMPIALDVNGSSMPGGLSGCVGGNERQFTIESKGEGVLSRKDDFGGAHLGKNGDRCSNKGILSTSTKKGGAMGNKARGFSGESAVTFKRASAARGLGGFETPLGDICKGRGNHKKKHRFKGVTRSAMGSRTGTSSRDVQVPITSNTTTTATLKKNPLLTEVTPVVRSLSSTPESMQINKVLNDKKGSLHTDSVSQGEGIEGGAISTAATSDKLTPKSETAGQDMKTKTLKREGCSIDSEDVLVSILEQSNEASAPVDIGTGLAEEVAPESTQHFPKGNSTLEREGDQKSDSLSGRKGAQKVAGGTKILSLPQVAASSFSEIREVLMSEKQLGRDGDGVVLVPAAPMLSQKGRALLDALESSVLCDEPLPQAQARSANTFSTRPAVSPSPVSFLMTSQSDIRVGSRSKTEEEEELEDIIALLRWLADMRERKLMSEKRFVLAVDCIQANAEVPFFFCEGNGNGPTLMVRLPRDPDEVVSVPLLGVSLHLPRSSSLIGGGTAAGSGGAGGSLGDGGRLQPVVVGTSDKVSDVSVELGRAGAPLPWQSHKRVAGVEPSLLRAPHLKVRKPPRLLGHVGPPNTHFHGYGELPAVSAASLKAQPCPQMPVRHLVFHTPESHSVDVNRSGKLAKLDKDKKHEYSPQAYAHKPRCPGGTVFNPAAPQETSPYNKSMRTATYIATGTSSFMI